VEELQSGNGIIGASDERNRFSDSAFADSHAPEPQTIETDLYDGTANPFFALLLTVVG